MHIKGGGAIVMEFGRERLPLDRGKYGKFGRATEGVRVGGGSWEVADGVANRAKGLEKGTIFFFFFQYLLVHLMMWFVGWSW